MIRGENTINGPTRAVREEQVYNASQPMHQNHQLY
jgi:hypothetical protein